MVYQEQAVLEKTYKIRFDNAAYFANRYNFLHLHAKVWFSQFATMYAVNVTCIVLYVPSSMLM